MKRPESPCHVSQAAETDHSFRQCSTAHSDSEHNSIVQTTELPPAGQEGLQVPAQHESVEDLLDSLVGWLQADALCNTPERLLSGEKLGHALVGSTIGVERHLRSVQESTDGRQCWFGATHDLSLVSLTPRSAALLPWSVLQAGLGQDQIL